MCCAPPGVLSSTIGFSNNNSYFNNNNNNNNCCNGECKNIHLTTNVQQQTSILKQGQNDDTCKSPWMNAVVQHRLKVQREKLNQDTKKTVIKNLTPSPEINQKTFSKTNKDKEQDRLMSPSNSLGNDDYSDYFSNKLNLMDIGMISPSSSIKGYNDDEEEEEEEKEEESIGNLHLQSISTMKEREMYKHSKVLVKQNPIRSRMIGFGLKDRRPLDPPPIVQLVSNDQSYIFSNNSRFICHVALWSIDMKHDLSIVLSPSSTNYGETNNTEKTYKDKDKILDEDVFQTLTGSLTSSCSVANDLENNKGMFFTFPDLCVRIPGQFRLKFKIVDISGTWNKSSCAPVKEFEPVFSDIFTVYHPKEFPGMSKSTELSKCLAPQGTRIHISTSKGNAWEEKEIKNKKRKISLNVLAETASLQIDNDNKDFKKNSTKLKKNRNNDSDSIRPISPISI